ncbi:MAG: Ig-like domain-containing protein, partial [Armatimonadetes bacterium]|nr:Ig-like domain-containing protein [Armatimonadota bacterium]
MKSLMRTVLVLSGLVICTSATLALDVVFSPNPLVFNPGETTKTVTVQFKDIPAGTAIANIGFYFTYDKTHVALSNPQWKISTDQTVPPVDRADGMVIMAAAQSQPVQGPQTTVNIVELTVTLSNVNPGDQFEIGFKTSAAENGLLDPDLNAVAANWGTCNVQVSTGPPNPPSVESFDIRSPQKDPVQFTINLSSQGNVPTRVDVQYREKGTQTWTNIPQTAVTINGKVVTVNWDSPATDGQTKVYELRAMAWDREQHSDWSASAEITVDNQAPYIVSASGYQKTVTVRFNERVQKGPAETVANWEVKAKTTGTAANVTKAQLGTDGQTVTLTLASDLEENKEYTVTARNIVDLAGNQRAATSKDFVAVSKPRLVEVRFQGPRVIDVVFNAPIDPATLGQAKDWSLTPAVVITKVEWRAQDVAARLTLGADLSQYAQYTVTAPSTIKNPAGQSLGTDNTIQFRTPIWHLFAQGTHLLGIPGEIGGQRLRNVLGATAVAIWDEAS